MLRIKQWLNLFRLDRSLAHRAGGPFVCIAFGVSCVAYGF
jgi:hypothetical protein